MIGRFFLVNYKTFAILFLNLLILFSALNFFAWAGMQMFGEVYSTGDKDVQSDTNPWVAHHGLEKLTDVFPDIPPREINNFLNETWVATQEYAPFYQIESAVTQGKYLNVHEIGFRSIGAYQANWPPSDRSDQVIFVFGGSTTFGSGVRDEQTIPAYLQKALRVKFPNKSIDVYNFGTGSHFSTQERFMFDRLLAKRYVPDVAIFIDGLNDSYFWEGEPAHTSWYRNMAQIIQDYSWRFDAWYHFTHWLKALPLGHLAAKYWRINEKPAFWRGDISDAEASDKNKIEAVLNRWQDNKLRTLALAQLFDVETLFVWQPVPFFEYPGKNVVFELFGDAVGGHLRSTYTYPAMKALYQNGKLDDKVAWCADIQKNITKNMYVDHVHYNPEMSSRVADCIVEHDILTRLD